MPVLEERLVQLVVLFLVLGLAPLELLEWLLAERQVVWLCCYVVLPLSFWLLVDLYFEEVRLPQAPLELLLAFAPLDLLHHLSRLFLGSCLAV